MVRRKVETGPYRSVDEVLEEALRLLDARDRQSQDSELTQPAADELSVAGLPFTTSQEMQHAGFPFNVSEDFSSDQGKKIEAIMARGAPDWVRSLRRRSNGEPPVPGEST